MTPKPHAGARFRADFERLVDTARPVALARFHDGEFRVLRGERYRARSGWTVNKKSWLRDRLETALRADLEDYWVGISPPCDYPQGTHYYRSRVRARRTFATVFWHRNYGRFVEALRGPLSGACVVTSGKGDYRVPPNGVANRWDLDALVSQLLEETRPILVAAGPCACVIVYEYWRRQDPDRRQTILDVGAAIDPVVHGKATRDFHLPSSILRVHSCSWDQSVPWAPAAIAQAEPMRSVQLRLVKQEPQDMTEPPDLKSATRWGRIHKQRAADKKSRRRKKPPRGTKLFEVSDTTRGLARKGNALAPSSRNIAPIDLHDDLVTVSLPYYNAGGALLARALESILEQDHQHLRVLVTGDGVALPGSAKLERLLSDPRVVQLRTQQNWGPYFHHEVASRASRVGFLAIQDADDVSLRERLSTQLDAILTARADVCLSPIIDERPGKAITTVLRPPGPTFAHRAEHFGLWNNPSVRAMGGYYGGYRLGLDTLMTSAVLLLGTVAKTKQPLYRRVSRERSLSRSSGTGHGTPAREAAKAKMRSTYNELVQARTKRSRAAAVEIVKRSMRSGAGGHAGAIEDLAASARARLAQVKIDPPPARKALVKAVIASAPSSSWAIGSELAFGLYRFCERTRPKVLLDVGSGLSTLVLGLYAARYNAKLVSLEHDTAWFQKTRAALSATGLGPSVTLLRTGMRRYGSYTWYDFDPQAVFGNAAIDFMMIDGPPEGLGHGRDGAVLRCLDHLRPGSRIWLHDGARAGERAAVERWKRHLQLAAVLSNKLDKRGVWQLEVRGKR